MSNIGFGGRIKENFRSLTKTFLMSQTSIESDLVAHRSDACNFLKNLLGIPEDVPIGKTLFYLFCADADDKQGHVVYVVAKEKITAIATEQKLKEKAQEFFSFRKAKDYAAANSLYANTVTELRLVLKN